MKKVEAIIRPYLLEPVQQGLIELGLLGMSFIEIKGLGNQRGHTEIYRGLEKKLNFLPKIKVEIIVPDDLVEDCIEVIMKHARTGKVGDGKIFISPIERVVRIRTGEEDYKAT